MELGLYHGLKPEGNVDSRSGPSIIKPRPVPSGETKELYCRLRNFNPILCPWFHIWCTVFITSSTGKTSWTCARSSPTSIGRVEAQHSTPSAGAIGTVRSTAVSMRTWMPAFSDNEWFPSRNFTLSLVTSIISKLITEPLLCFKQ